MIFYICMAAAAAVTVIVIISRFTADENTDEGRLPAQTLLALTLFDTCILYIPWFIYSWQTGEAEFRNSMLFFPFMIVRLMQTVSLDADYGSALEIAALADRSGVNTAFLQFYTVVLSYISVMVPLTGAMTVLGFFGNKIGSRYEVSRFSRKKKIYIFNGAGEKNLSLAKSIRLDSGAEKADCAFLFCNVREDPAMEAKRAIRKIGGWFMPDYPSMLLKLVRYNCQREIRYFLLEEDDRNFRDVINILKTADKYSKQNDDLSEADRVKITMLLRSNELDNILDAQKKHGIDLRIIDTERLYAQDLFRRWPLFSCLRAGKDTMNLVIIGDGDTAQEVLMNAIWMGCIQSASLKIRFISGKASAVKNTLRMNCPALFDPALAGGEEYTIEFEDLEGETDYINKNFSDADYVVIAGEQDETNIRIAMWCRTWIARERNPEQGQPFLAVCIRDGKRAEQAEQLCIQENSEVSYDLHVFGTDSILFNARHMLNSRLGKSLYRVQLSYICGGTEFTATEEQEKEAWRELNQSVYNYRSSEASALYIVNRLFDSGALLGCMRRRSESPDRDYSGEEQAAYWKEVLAESDDGGSRELLDEIFDVYEEKISDPEVFESLSATEHRRWIAYMACKGWEAMSKEAFIKWIALHNGTYKDYLRLRHPCMVSWDDLEELSLLYTKGESTERFKKMDRMMISGVRRYIV